MNIVGNMKENFLTICRIPFIGSDYMLIGVTLL